jgi:hypothetical protein
MNLRMEKVRETLHGNSETISVGGSFKKGALKWAEFVAYACLNLGSLRGTLVKKHNNDP